VGPVHSIDLYEASNKDPDQPRGSSHGTESTTLVYKPSQTPSTVHNRVNISDLLVHAGADGENGHPEAALSEPLQRRSGVGQRFVDGSEILPSGSQSLHERTFNERLSKKPPFSINQGFEPRLSDGTSIPELERQIKALRGYSADLLELSLLESHAKVQERIALLQTRVEQRRYEKSRAVLSSLQEDFPDIAEIAKDEARELGLINDWS
jgi:hypothetical protein